MDRERLTALLLDPAQIASGDLAAVRTMAEQFPWFSGAQLLLALGRHASGDVLANADQDSPAAFLPSRAVLYDMLQRDGPATKPALVPPATSPAPLEPWTVAPVVATPAPVQQVPEPVPGPLAPPSAEGFPSPAPVFAPLGPETAPDPSPAPAEPALAGPLPVQVTQAAKGPEEDILQQQFQEAIRAGGYLIGHFEAGMPAKLAPPMAVPHTVHPVDARLAEPELLAAILPPPLVQTPARLKFTDWLLQQDHEPQPPPVVVAHLPSLPEQRSVGNAALAQSEGSTAPDAVEIMEKFIRRGEAGAKPKATFFNPQQAAKKSLEDHGMVSETLAQILEKQGNFPKAKEIYDRLALNHPDKSVYFAALSKALEGRSNK